MPRKNIKEFAQRYGTNPQEVREILKDMIEFVMESPDNKVQFKPLGIFFRATDTIRAFRRGNKVYTAPLRNVVRMKPIGRRADLRATINRGAWIRLSFLNFEDGYPNVANYFGSGIRVSNEVIDLGGETFDRQMEIVPQINKRELHVKGRHITAFAGQGSITWEHRTTVFIQTDFGWAAKNKENSLVQGFRIIADPWNNPDGLGWLVNEPTSTLPLDTEERAFVSAVWWALNTQGQP